jgi:hypothetical protein
MSPQPQASWHHAEFCFPVHLVVVCSPHDIILAALPPLVPRGNQPHRWLTLLALHQCGQVVHAAEGHDPRLVGHFKASASYPWRPRTLHHVSRPWHRARSLWRRERCQCASIIPSRSLPSTPCESSQPPNGFRCPTAGGGRTTRSPAMTGRVCPPTHRLSSALWR